MRHTLTPTQTSNQVHKPTHRQPHSATVLGKCLTTICACGKRRVRAEAASHADADAAGAAAGDVLEPYLCLRLVLAFYLFALFVCAVCLPQQSTWNLCADVLAKLPADTHTYTQTKTNPHTHPHLAHHTHTHTLAHSSVCVFDLARISIVNPCEKSTCASLAQATHVSSSPIGQLHSCHCHQLGNELLEFPLVFPLYVLRQHALAPLPLIILHFLCPILSLYLIRQRVSLFNYTSNIQFQFKSHQMRLLKLNWFRTPKEITCTCHRLDMPAWK